MACSAYLGVRLGCVGEKSGRATVADLNHLVRLRILPLSLPDHSKVEVLPTAYRVRFNACSVGLSELGIIAVLSTRGPRNGCPSSIPVKASQM